MNDSYIYVIAALLPLTSLMLVLQSNPYHALVVRGIVGAVAALVYAVLGAADVALTEALVGTMLAIMLYAVAVRSSLVMRLGVVAESEAVVKAEGDRDLQDILDHLRSIVAKRHLKLELVSYPNEKALQQALIAKEIHATCLKSEIESQPYQTTTRVRHLYDIFQQELTLPVTGLAYLSAED